MAQENLLIIGYTWPEPETTAAGKRMLQLIHFFKEQQYSITFASTAAQSTYSFDLASLSVKCQRIELNSTSFDDFVAELNPTVVLFDRFLTEEQFGWRIAQVVSNALRILDTEDLHSLRTAREKCIKSKLQFTSRHWLQHELTKRELASIFRCDLSMIISTYEMQLLTQEARIDENILMHLPFQLEVITTTIQQKWFSYSDRAHFVCIGNGKHAPNVDAIKFLKQEIWPLIRKSLPKAELHIYGAYLPEQIQQMHKPDEGFLVKGWAENLHDVLGKGRVNLAPVRFGAGIKGKLIDAMQYGIPSVTTVVGAEGMHGNLPWNGSIEDTSKAIAEASIALYQNETVWKTAQNNGIAIVNSLYDKKQLDEDLLHKLKKIQNNLQAHRIQNVVGGILMHQTMASTKYMSKWIEEKNKG